jgi:hypothetical protein
MTPVDPLGPLTILFRRARTSRTRPRLCFASRHRQVPRGQGIPEKYLSHQKYHFAPPISRGQSLTVAVETIIADRPPHRTVRAALPHTAPTSEDWRAMQLLAHRSITGTLVPRTVSLLFIKSPALASAISWLTARMDRAFLTSWVNTSFVSIGFVPQCGRGRRGDSTLLGWRYPSLVR